MKRLGVVTMAAATVLTVQMGIAQTPETAHVWSDPQGWWGNHFVYDRAGSEKFTANEFSVDMFGSYIAGERKLSDLFETNIRHGTWGGGVGANYFFTKQIGLGADINIPDNNGNFIDSANASLIGRFPIEHAGIAPYIFGGGGRQTEPRWEWTGHAGAGLEVRLNPITGLFTDARYTWADKNSDSLLLRAGLRFVF